MDDTLYVPTPTAVKKAGERCISDKSTPEELQASLEIVSIWRSLHSYPINTIQALLRNKIKTLELKEAIVAQRLKRLPSINAKMIRHKTKLNRMQDIGGIRVILKNMNDVRALHNNLCKSRFEHELITPADDYISEPKPDGYRSLHQIFKYGNKQHPELNVLKIELQIRTKLQHAWATAVETLGMIERSSFKTGEGSNEYKEFFKLSSALISIKESEPILEEYRNYEQAELVHKFFEIEERLRIFMKLESIAITARKVSGVSDKNSYHLVRLRMSTEGSAVSITPFAKDQREEAASAYLAAEQETKSDPNTEVVLIYAGNLRDIKKAYPNYFLDTHAFIKALREICKKFGYYSS